MIGEESLTFVVAPLVFDFYVTAKGKRLCPFAWFRLNGHQHHDRSVSCGLYSDRVICCIFNECFDNNEISLNLVRYIANIFRPLTCSVVIYRYGFDRYRKRVNGRISFGIK